jgi:hypothetical protein
VLKSARVLAGLSEPSILSRPMRSINPREDAPSRQFPPPGQQRAAPPTPFLIPTVAAPHPPPSPSRSAGMLHHLDDHPRQPAPPAPPPATSRRDPPTQPLLTLPRDTLETSFLLRRWRSVEPLPDHNTSIPLPQRRHDY